MPKQYRTTLCSASTQRRRSTPMLGSTGRCRATPTQGFSSLFHATAGLFLTPLCRDGAMLLHALPLQLFSSLHLSVAALYWTVRCRREVSPDDALLCRFDAVRFSALPPRCYVLPCVASAGLCFALPRLRLATQSVSSPPRFRTEQCLRWAGRGVTMPCHRNASPCGARLGYAMP